MKSILGAGNALTDLIYHFPDSSIPEKFGFRPGSMNHVGDKERVALMRALEGIPHEYVPGGSAANTVVAASLLGMESGFIGKVGDDVVGRLYMKNLVENGVEPYLFSDEKMSGCSIILMTPEGERSCVVYLGAALELKADDISAELFARYDYLHVEGYLLQCPQVVEKSFELARKSGMTISFDLGSYNIVARHIGLLQRLVGEYVDIVFANEEEALAFTGKRGEEAAAAISAMGKGKTAVVKLGSRGSIVQKGERAYCIDAERVEVADTIGAGDAYAAGFLYAHSLGCDLRQCGQAGSLLASRAVMEFGPKIGKNGWEAVKKRISHILVVNH